MTAPAALGIGTATFLAGYGIDARTPGAEAAAALLRDAIAGGVRYVDTAAAYGDSETIVGLVAPLIKERGVRVCTKTSGEPAGFADALRRSLSRLGLATVDTVLLHSASTAQTADAGIGGAMEALVAQGLARRTGASTYGDAAARGALAQPWCRVVQVEHSILNPSVVRALGTTRDGAEVVARSVLCKGLLTERRRAAPGLASPLTAVLDELERLAAGWGFALPELAIRFALDTPGVDVVVVGVSTPEEMATALRARDGSPLGADQLATLATFDRSHLDAVHPERWDILAKAGA